MSLFHNISFSRLRNDEMYNLSKGIHTLSGNYTGEGQPLTPFIENHTAAHQKLDNAMMQEQSSVITSQIAEADDMQDEAFLAFRFYVEAFTHVQDETKKMAAERLMNKIKTYGYSLFNMTYTEQKSRMGNLVDDLENDAQATADVALIGAEERVASMKATHETFMNLTEQRYAEDLQKPEYTTLEARKDIKTALRDMFNFADAMHAIQPEGPYKPFANEVNQHIDEVMRNVKMRGE